MAGSKPITRPDVVEYLVARAASELGLLGTPGLTLFRSPGAQLARDALGHDRSVEDFREGVLVPYRTEGKIVLEARLAKLHTQLSTEEQANFRAYWEAVVHKAWFL